MNKIINEKFTVNIISETKQMLVATYVSPLFTLDYDENDEEMIIDVVGLTDSIKVKLSRVEWEELVEKSYGELIYTINVLKHSELTNEEKVTERINMYDVNTSYSLYSVEMLSNVSSDNSLDVNKSFVNISARIESIFQVLRLNAGSIDTIVKFYDDERFYILDENKLSIEPVFLKPNQDLRNVKIAPFKSQTEYRPEGIILNNTSLRFPAIVKYSGKILDYWVTK